MAGVRITVELGLPGEASAPVASVTFSTLYEPQCGSGRFGQGRFRSGFHAVGFNALVSCRQTLCHCGNSFCMGLPVIGRCTGASQLRNFLE